MGLLGRTILKEVMAGAGLGVLLFTFVVFLQRLSLLFETLVRGSAPGETVAYLFLLVLPSALMMSIPIGVLVGVLIGLNRMSSDGEIIALRAAGVPSRAILKPVLAFAGLAFFFTGACSLYLTPLSIRESFRVVNDLVAEQMTAEIQPRVFAEQFPNRTLYVGDVIPGPIARWRNVFVLDTTPADKRASLTPDSSPVDAATLPQASVDAPRITIATEAIAVPDAAHNRIQLRYLNGSTHEISRSDGRYISMAFPNMDQALDAARPAERTAKAYTDMETMALRKEAKLSREADIELQRRLSLPFACLVLAMIGVPLGVSSRKAGKSAAFAITVLLAFLFYMTQVSLIGVAKQGRISPWLGAWLPNILFGLAAILLLLQIDKAGDQDLISRIRNWFTGAAATLSSVFRDEKPATAKSSSVAFRILPTIIDTYILQSFLFWFFTLLVSFVFMTQIFTFFELMGDILRNKIPLDLVLRYHLFLSAKLIYDSTPLSILVAVLITFGILSKNNEVTAFKACGVSLYRLALPVVGMSLVLSGALFAFDYYVVPDANLIQDGLRNEIKGRPVQTYLSANRKLIRGNDAKIFYYKYFDPNEKVMAGVHVFELDPKTFMLNRHISAERAVWQPGIQAWVFQNGWVRDLERQPNQATSTKLHQTYQVQTFKEINESPEYFVKEEKQYKQMNFHQLQLYIEELQQSGFDTTKLQVQYHRKFAVPLFALILAIIAVPFSFLSGKRGAMASVGASFVIAIAYLAVGELFVQVGNLNQLPAVMAAWIPDGVFLLAGTYLITRMRT